MAEDRWDRRRGDQVRLSDGRCGVVEHVNRVTGHLVVCVAGVIVYTDVDLVREAA